MGIPQIIYVVLLAMSLGINWVNHDKQKTGFYNFGETLISVIIILGLLYWGGFFS